MKRRYRQEFACALAGLALLFWTPTGRCEAVEAPQVTARGAVLMEATTGRILFEQNARKALPMASVTKVMTALLAVEGADLTAVVTVDARACGVGGTSIYLQAGEQLTVEQLLYGLMLPSGNDAAVALAYYLSGSVEAFADLMNQRAGQLGCVNTHFINPNGLPAQGHYTTAADMARICAYAIQNPVFERIVTTQSAVIPGVTWARHLSSKNRLLWQYEGCNGIKTGYTKAAGRCLASAARRDGMQLVAVALNCPNMWQACTQLMDYGFATYAMNRVIRRGDALGEVTVLKGLRRQVELVAGQDVVLPLSREGGEASVITLSALESAEAPVKAGERAGTAWVTLQDMVVEVELLYGQDVERDTLLNRLRDAWQRWYNEAMNSESEDTLCGFNGTWLNAG